MLEVNELSASYGVIPALHGVSFNVRQSEIVTILGSNGTGKSTILNVIQGMMTGTSVVAAVPQDVTSPAGGGPCR